MKDIFSIKKIPTYALILGAVFVAGIFIRTYHYHDWLRMNADQARDAALVSRTVEGIDPLPLLGPKAGGTEFKLGPAFYWFEAASAKVFGDYPDRMAYPDLLCSILAIPLLYALLRRYFDVRIAGSLAALYALSFYALKYSRFAWNPNSTPFWTMLFLYALLRVFDDREKRRYLWVVVCGIAVGIGVQLHTFLLAALPVVTILSFGYYGMRNRSLVKPFLVIVLVSLFLNVPQIVNESRTGGANVKALFGGMKKKQEASKTYLDKVIRDGECFTAANIQIVSSAYYDNDTCDIADAKQPYTLPIGLVGTVFFLGGIALAVRGVRRETDPEKRRFLGLMLTYVGVLALLILPVAYEISLRYFLILAWMPFFFLGLWLEFLGERFGHLGREVGFVALAILFMTNCFAIGNYFTDLSGYGSRPDAAGFDIVYLGETERMADYMTMSAGGAKTAYIGGNKTYLFKAENALTYLAGKDGLTLVPLSKERSAVPVPVFYLVSTKAKKDFVAGLVKSPTGVIGAESFGRFTIVSVIPVR